MYCNDKFKIKKSKHKMLIFIFLAVAFCVSCSTVNNKDDNDTSTPTSEIQEQNEGKSGDTVTSDKKLFKEITDLVYTNVEIQRTKKTESLNNIYTDEFINNTIQKDDDFFKDIHVVESEYYPVIDFDSEKNEYVVIIWLTVENGDVSALFKHVFIKRDSSNKLKIFDIQYDG